MQLVGRTAIITGARTGIGLGVAQAYLREGANVVMGGRDESGHDLAKEMAPDGRAIYVQGDVRKPADLHELVQVALARFEKVDILVNNAGGSDGFAMVHEMSDEAWDNALDWNLRSVFRLTRAVLPGMMARNWGRIINMSSVEGKQANKATVSHYITNKHALNGFTKAVAFEYGSMGITSNAICPGAIETQRMKEAGPQVAAAEGTTYEQFLEHYASAAAIKRLNTVEEIAAVAVLLASDIGGGVNGALWNVDGGTAQW